MRRCEGWIEELERGDKIEDARRAARAARVDLVDFDTTEELEFTDEG